jgi:thioredoxin-like negative regulator of GroEL
MLTQYRKPTLIEVMTPHCVECRAMKPDLDAVAEQHSGMVDLVLLDATEQPAMVAGLNVRGTPTLIAVKDGAEIARFTGRRSRSELTELFTAVAGGDAGTLERTSRSDRVVWATAGVLLAGVGFLTGPAWPLVVFGAALVGFASLRSVRR